jgi:hypothetical protein
MADIADLLHRPAHRFYRELISWEEEHIDSIVASGDLTEVGEGSKVPGMK